MAVIFLKRHVPNLPKQLGVEFALGIQGRLVQTALVIYQHRSWQVKKECTPLETPSFDANPPSVSKNPNVTQRHVMRWIGQCLVAFSLPLNLYTLWFISHRTSRHYLLRAHAFQRDTCTSRNPSCVAYSVTISHPSLLTHKQRFDVACTIPV